ncbi:hypothetical protein HMI54_007805, partial [Coelomomyces lativittatus]
MHSYTYPDHERKLAKEAKALGFTSITVSSDVVLARRNFVSRGHTAVLDAYLTPVLNTYMGGFQAGFTSLENVEVLVMQSDGGLTTLQEFRGYQAILSGPAAGVVGYAKTLFSETNPVPLIGFDMGGTSTDVSRFDGDFAHVLESTTAGIPICTPQLDIQTVAAGGSSCLFYRNGLFVVGPESAGSEPGPLCYRKQGAQLTLTDANVVLGRMALPYFPHVFGPQENEPLDLHASLQGFEQLKSSSLPTFSMDVIAYGFVQVANTTMAQKILALTHAKGLDVRQHTLACFGGAGAQHAVALAQHLGIPKVWVHRHASILSAYGLALAHPSHELHVPVHVPCVMDSVSWLREKFMHAISTLPSSLTQVQCYLVVRYEGTDTDLLVKIKDIHAFQDVHEVLDDVSSQYLRMFGFQLHRPVYVEGLRVRAWSPSKVPMSTPPTPTTPPVDPPPPLPRPSCMHSMYVDPQVGRQQVPLYEMKTLVPGQRIVGPALIVDAFVTLVLIHGSQVLVQPNVLEVTFLSSGHVPRSPSISSDPVQLSLFGHRFMHIAEEMGRVLQKTAISTNIKERLDFSCALFTPEGHLVANAPHIPVHLGSMQAAIQSQLTLHPTMNEGDVFLTNHPALGGSHLPDLTVITPVFDQHHLQGFVASRGHHADIGGCTPGSMPAFSTSLDMEGAIFESVQLVENGHFQEDLIKELFQAPAKVPGNEGARNVHENISDLKAQVAANQ